MGRRPEPEIFSARWVGRDRVPPPPPYPNVLAGGRDRRVIAAPLAS